MITKLAYPFDKLLMRQNALFLSFCPPDCLDEDGRPVLEGRSVFHKLEERVYRSCPYNDSRAQKDKPINLEGLQHLQKYQSYVFGLIDQVAAHCRAESGYLSSGTGLEKLYAFSYILYKAPNYYFMKELLCEPTAIPATLSVVSRFSHGLVNMLSVMALENGGRLDNLNSDAEDLYRYADQRGYLVGKNEVCAAPKGLIIKYIGLLKEACESMAEVNVESEGCILPDSQIDSICRLAKIMQELELITLIYETVRCSLWTQLIKRSKPVFDLSMTKPRFAITHCLVAQKISRENKPFEHDLFRRAYNLSMPTEFQKQAFKELLILANDVIHGSHDIVATANADKRHRLKRAVIQLLERNSTFFIKNFKCRTLLSADLDLFFGQWPN